MKKPLESELGFFPTDAQAAVVLEPGDRAFHGPTPAVSAQGSTVLGLGAVGTVGRDHFDAMGGQFGIQGIAVISLVANDSRGLLLGEHEAEEFLDEPAFVGRGRGGCDRHRQTFGINEDHDFDSLSSLGAADSIAAALGFGEGSIDEAFVEAEAALLFDKSAESLQKGFKNTVLDPAGKPTVDAAFGAVSFRQIFPFRSVVKNPEDARQGLPFGNRRAATLRTGLKIGNEFAEGVELRACKNKHVI